MGDSTFSPSGDPSVRRGGICAHCGMLFRSYNPNPKYCSRKCKDDAQIVPIDLGQAVALYHGGLSQAEVATRLGVTTTVIEKAFARANIRGRKWTDNTPRGKDSPQWRGGKQRSKGYVRVPAPPDHPRAHRNYIYEHILVMEKHLGRYLLWFGLNDPRTEVVHHRNEIKADNRLENLQVLTNSQHRALHNRLRAQKRRQRG